MSLCSQIYTYIYYYYFFQGKKKKKDLSRAELKKRSLAKKLSS